MITFPNCKINLGLHVLDKREDGFHNLETIFYPINIKDALEIIPSTENLEVTYTSSGIVIDGTNDNNLCVKAYKLIKKDFPNLPNIKLHLHKAIPIGAGLGGGSADAAFTIKLLNNKFKLNLTNEQLIEYACQLGSDCAFFIVNQPCFATNRGEILTTINVDLSQYKFIIVNPSIHINTGWAFGQLKKENFLKKSSTPNKDIKQIVAQPISQWKENLKNDFEKVVFDEYPTIKIIKDTLYKQGALYAAMSGSGSTLFGIFEKTENPKFLFPSTYLVKEITT